MRNIRVIAQLSDRITEPMLRARAGINVTQYALLTTVNEFDDQPISQQMLVDRLSSTRGTISRQVSLARKLDFITVNLAPDSKREYRLALTTKGKETLAKANTFDLDFTAGRKESISDEEITATIATLEKLSEILKDYEVKL